ncbi:MAG: hypothetical protein KKD63_13340 [Proteobacteria bacterium]|nr:hypothetical protein [Pseudomonadota bacterium]
MECERFKKLLKTWYIQVQNEALAPARMVDFMENHVTDCPVCLMDPDAKRDIAKIITLVLPQDKLRQTVRTAQDEEADELADEVDDSTDTVEDETEDEESDETLAPEDDEDEELDEDLDIEEDDEKK